MSRDERPHRCLTCDSPDPERHPAVQFGGEVQVCGDPWHEPIEEWVWPTVGTDSLIRQARAWAASAASRNFLIDMVLALAQRLEAATRPGDPLPPDESGASLAGAPKAPAEDGDRMALVRLAVTLLDSLDEGGLSIEDTEDAFATLPPGVQAVAWDLKAASHELRSAHEAELAREARAQAARREGA